MRFVTEYKDIAEARKASADKATAMGCGRHPDDITRYWYPVIEHPETKAAAMQVEDDYPTARTKRTRAELVEAGWFADGAKVR